MNVSTFLKILTKYGYPNPSILAIANSVDYNLDYFLHDLKKEMGEDGVLAFCDRAIEKLTGEKGLRIDMGGPNGDEYVYIHIYPLEIKDTLSALNKQNNFEHNGENYSWHLRNILPQRPNRLASQHDKRSCNR